MIRHLRNAIFFILFMQYRFLQNKIVILRNKNVFFVCSLCIYWRRHLRKHIHFLKHGGKKNVI